MRTILAALVFLSAPAAALVAQTPDTEIFVAELRRTDGRLRIGEPYNATARPGYDNQPWFLPDGRSFLYVSEREGQQDVFRYDLGRREAFRITLTPEREFSPSLLPGGEMMVVRWAADMSEGGLWIFSAEGQPMRAATVAVPRVGYYALADERTMALFVNDSVQSFVLADALTGETEKIGENLGGSPPRAIPGERAFSFLRQDEEGRWWITRLDPETRRTTPLVQALPGQTQYTWTPSGEILMASGNRVYLWDPEKRGEWTEIAAFDAPELREISRIAVSPTEDRIALVATLPE